MADGASWSACIRLRVERAKPPPSRLAWSDAQNDVPKHDKSRRIPKDSALLPILTLATLICAIPAWAADCPNAAKAAADYTVEAQQLSGDGLNAFNALRDDGIARFAPVRRARAVLAVPNPATPRASVSPLDVAQYLETTAASELESYAISELVKELCTNQATGAYFPNTCSSQVATGAANSDAAAQADELRMTLRLDIEALPACVIYQRSTPSSSYGYLLTSALEQLVSKGKHDYRALLHGLATNPTLAKECDAFPNTDSGGCQFYLTTVAADAALIIRAEQKESGMPFTFRAALGDGTSATALTIAQQVAGTFLADLTLARCPVAPNGAAPTVVCTTDAPINWWVQLFAHYSQANGAHSSLVTLLEPSLVDVDAMDDVDATIRALSSSEQAVSGQATGTATTATLESLDSTDTARLQQLQIQLLGGIPSLLAAMLVDFGKLSILPSPNSQDLQLQVQQLVAVLGGTGRAYVDFQSKNYPQAVNDIESIGTAECTGPNDKGQNVAKPLSACGFFFQNGGFGDATLNVLAFAAEVSDAKSASDVAAIALSRGGGPNAWKAAEGSRLFWAGSFVGVQGGAEHLSATGYSASGADYGGFAPLGIGVSWPHAFFGVRPLTIYVSAVDLGSLISTSAAFSSKSGNVSSKAQTGWSQVLAPGIYLSTPLIGPLYAGIGYAYRTPALRAVTLPNGTQIDANSSRVEAFIGVDVSLFFSRF